MTKSDCIFYIGHTANTKYSEKMKLYGGTVNIRWGLIQAKKIIELGKGRHFMQ